MEKELNLLLVEDNAGHAELVMRNLRKHEIPNNVFHVKDGEEAINYLHNKEEFEDKNKYSRPDIILLDLRLPKIDGLEVLKNIKEDNKLKKIPVVILTTSNAVNDVEKAYELNANSYLVKPIDYTDFNNLLTTFGFYWLKWNQNLKNIK